jgi:PHD/YefM family antitoxin component YafN of YafNO toxin-antitoxin module
MRRGRFVAVVLSVADYERMSGRSVLPLVEFLSSAGVGELNLPERDRTDIVRDIEL